MGNRKPRQSGPQDHAEGDHGAKTRRRIIEQLQSRPPEEAAQERPFEDSERHRATAGSTTRAPAGSPLK